MPQQHRSSRWDTVPKGFLILSTGIGCSCNGSIDDAFSQAPLSSPGHILNKGYSLKTDVSVSFFTLIQHGFAD